MSVWKEGADCSTVVHFHSRVNTTLKSHVGALYKSTHG